MYCCPNCFSDEFLKKQISTMSNGNGKCSFCESDDVKIIAPNLLYEMFESLIDIYRKDSDGVLLSNCIQRDWNTFAIDENDLASNMLAEITGDDQVKTEKYCPRVDPDSTKLEKWRNFKDELIYKNRFFPEKVFDEEGLKISFQLLTLHDDIVPSELFRARVNSNSASYPIDEMGKPIYKKATNGRANPVGIPYLYAASNIETALSEVRPFKGEKVTVAKLEVIENLSLVDLRNPKQTISPFSVILSDIDLEKVYKDMPYLILLGEELSKPIIPREADLEYLPSQYLCEFVKHIGFEGIVYKSSLTDGDNYAIFEEDKLNRIDISQHKIDNIKIYSSQLTES